MADTDVVIKMLLDKASSKQVKDEAAAVASNLGKIEEKAKGISKGVNEWSKSLEEAERLSKKFGDEFTKRYEAAIQSGKSLEEAIAGVRRELEQASKPAGRGGIDEQLKRAKQEAEKLQREVATIKRDLADAQIGRLRNAAGVLGSLGQTTLLTGAALSGGIFALAKNYIKDAEKADQLTRQWAAATDQIAEAQSRIGRVAAQAVLPFLEKAADVASKVAGFVEAHPEIVQAAFNTGLFVAGFGALSLAVSKGVKLVADIKYLATIPAQLEAARLQDQAANKQLLAAQQRLKDLNIPGGGGGGAGRLPIAPLPILATLLGFAQNAAIGRAASNFGARVAGFESPEDFWRQMAESLGIVKREADAAAGSLSNVAGAVEEAGTKAGRAVGRLQGSGNEQQVVAAFQQFQADMAQIEREGAAERTRIIQEAERQIADITARYNQQRADINRQFNANRASIIRDFNAESRRAEEDYAKQRADIIRDSGDEIREIEERHQENIRKLTLEHNDRMADLTASRDALGLVKEQRRFDREVDESEREANKEIAKRKEETARRLAELAAEFAAERAQRQAEFAQRLAENEARRQEELKQAAEAHQRELQQAREARAQQLRDLQESLNAERLRRREVFIAEINDLDAALLRERGQKQLHYSLILADAERLFAEFRRRSAAAASAPVHDYTGYAYPGIYRMAANGQPEWVMNGSATRAAERIIGGRLTQDAVLSALARGGGRSSRSVTYNDQRRFNASIPLSERRAIAKETAAMIDQELS